MDAGIIPRLQSLALIVAVSKNGVIGRGGRIPWRLSDDLKHFKKLTLGQTVIVGRKTHESIVAMLGSPLPDRQTIVVTRQKEYPPSAACVRVANSFEAACRLASNENQPTGLSRELFVIGGAELYRLAYPLARRAYVTLVECELEGDAFFEATFMPPEWHLKHHERYAGDYRNEYAWIWKTFERSKPENS